MPKKNVRAERKRRRLFAKAANALTRARYAKPVKITAPKPPKSAAEILNDNVEILKGLAQTSLRLQWTTLSEEGRVVRLKGRAQEGLAILACASLTKMDSSGTGKITLINEAHGDFSAVAARAIDDTIKSLRSPVEIVISKPAVAAETLLPQVAKIDTCAQLRAAFKAPVKYEKPKQDKPKQGGRHRAPEA